MHQNVYNRNMQMCAHFSDKLVHSGIFDALRDLEFTTYSGPWSLSSNTSYRLLWRNLEAARYGFRLVRLLWNLTAVPAGMSAEAPMKFQIGTNNFVASRLHGTFQTPYSLLNRGPAVCQYLTHWGRDRMADISQATFWNAFSWMKMNEFRWRFH